MTQSSDKIASLIGSRICHDLISPVGAVANGLELLEFAGVPQSPELSLVAESAGHASAQIRLFRLAFGEAAAGQRVSGEVVAGILRDIYAQGRIAADWQAGGALARPEVKAALLAFLCAEEALPGEGRIAVEEEKGEWRIRAEGPRLAPDPPLWNSLRGEPAPTDVSPAAVQFLLLPRALLQADMKSAIQLSDTQLEIALAR